MGGELAPQEGTGGEAAEPSPNPLISIHTTPTAKSCSDDLEFIEDLSLPDGAQVQPSQLVEKQWLVRNSGSCNWGPEYRLARLGRDAFGGTAEIVLYPAKAGTTATLSVVLTAPSDLGTYMSRWRARDPEKDFFGDEVFLAITVVP